MIPTERLEALALRLVALGAGTHPLKADPDVDEGVVTFATDSLGTVEVLLRRNAAIVASFRFEIARPPGPKSASCETRPKSSRPGPRAVGLRSKTRSLDDLRRIALAAPNDFGAWLSLGHANLVLHRDADAAAALQRALHLKPRHDFTRYLMGLAFSRLGRLSEAEHCFSALVSSDPKLDSAQSHLGVAAILNLAEARLELDRPLEALASIRPAAGLAMEILLRLANTSMNAGDHAGAIRTFEFLAKSDPSNLDILHGLGRSLLWVGRNADAEPWLRRAIKLYPGGVELWYDLGLACSRQGRASEARKAFRRVVRLEPKHAWGWYDLACLDSVEGKVDAAFRKLRKAVSLGFNRVAHAMEDKDLGAMKQDRRWDELVKAMHDAQGLPPEP